MRLLKLFGVAVLNVLIVAWVVSSCVDLVAKPNAAKVSIGADGQARPRQERVPESSVRDALAQHGMGRLLEIAADGDSKAQYIVAVVYLEGAVGVPRDFESSQRWMLRASNAGYPLAQVELAKRWYQAATGGDLLKVNGGLIRAFAWLGVAEAAGHSDAKAAMDQMLAVYLKSSATNLDREAFRDEILVPAQRLAAAWTPCKDPSCWDRDFSIPRHRACEERPSSVACLATQ